MCSSRQFGIDGDGVELEGLKFDFSRPDGDVEGFGVEVSDVASYGGFEDFEDCFFGHCCLFSRGSQCIPWNYRVDFWC